MATIVDVEALWQSAAAAFIAGLGVVFVFSLAVLGVARFADYSRDGRPMIAGLFGALTVAGVLVTAAAIVLGVVVMAS